MEKCKDCKTKGNYDICILCLEKEVARLRSRGDLGGI